MIIHFFSMLTNTHFIPFEQQLTNSFLDKTIINRR